MIIHRKKPTLYFAELPNLLARYEYNDRSQALITCQKLDEFGSAGRLVVICSDTEILVVKNYELRNILCCVGGNVGSEVWWQGPDSGHPTRCILNPSVATGGKGAGIIKTATCNLEGMVRNVVNVQSKKKYRFVQGLADGLVLSISSYDAVVEGHGRVESDISLNCVEAVHNSI